MKKILLILMMLGTCTISSSAQSLPKNKFTLKPYGVSMLDGLFYNLGINYERYLDKKNQFSLDFGFDYHNLMGSYSGTNIHFTLGIFHHFSPLNKFDYSIGLGYGISSEPYEQSANLYMTDGNKHLLIATNRITWNVSKKIFLGLEAMSFITFHRVFDDQEVQNELYFKPIAIRVGFRF